MLMSIEEPIPQHVLGHGWLLIDGGKMSKSKGNVVDPLDIVDQYGADTLRVYIMFMGEYGAAAPWNDSSVKGCRRYLDRVAGLTDLVVEGDVPELEVGIHKAIKKVSSDIEEQKYNTAIAALMTLLNDVFTLDDLNTVRRAQGMKGDGTALARKWVQRGYCTYNPATQQFLAKHQKQSAA